MQGPNPTVVVKKYSNRRLYDTSSSRYITLDELALKIRDGNDVRVVDAKTGNDLTQATLAQIILESRRAARLLPVPLLTQLIRMGDDALAEFFGKYMSWALELYVQARSGAHAMAPLNPFMSLPFTASNAIARFFNGRVPEGAAQQAAPPPPEPPPPPAEPQPQNEDSSQEIADLRKELLELKSALKETLLKNQE